MKKLLLTVAIVSMSIISVWMCGCGDAGGSAKTEPPVRLIVDFTNPFLESDVFEDDTNTYLSEAQPVNFRVYSVAPEPEDTSTYMDVIVTGYEVKYTRTDTGTEVPKTYVANCSIYCALDSTVEEDLMILRADQKMMPPLSYLWQMGYDPETGLDMIHTTCTLTAWGKTLAGKEVVSEPARITVNFANYAEE